SFVKQNPNNERKEKWRLHMPHTHDARYKQLFSSPLMVKRLVDSFVDAAELGGETIVAVEPVEKETVVDYMRRRQSDVLWKLRSSAVFYAENTDPHDIEQTMEVLANILQDEEPKLRREFLQWFMEYLRSYDVPFYYDEVERKIAGRQSMFGAKLEKYQEELRQEGREEGREDATLRLAGSCSRDRPGMMTRRSGTPLECGVSGCDEA
ncbi:MAG: hypothetical protein ACLFP4_13985, partial [Spirochaetales bacterium]